MASGASTMIIGMRRASRARGSLRQLDRHRALRRQQPRRAHEGAGAGPGGLDGGVGPAAGTRTTAVSPSRTTWPNATGVSGSVTGSPSSRVPFAEPRSVRVAPSAVTVQDGVVP